jgi:hypothetical protein
MYVGYIASEIDGKGEQNLQQCLERQEEDDIRCGSVEDMGQKGKHAQ